ncbi:unnamed protein product, partial [Timema podura]|nr:unnamed protein product [Timema podura]
MNFLLESLHDLDTQLRKFGGQLFLFQGSPVHIFERLWEEVGLQKICFEQDPEPIWHARDSSVKQFCEERGIHWVEKVSHTLWDPHQVVKINGGTPPLTYQMF